jgi:DNA polymerase III gamma/tau subunit
MFIINPRNKKILDGIITNQTLAHAYLFTGQASPIVNGAIDYFAQSLTCLAFDNGPCQKCAACLKNLENNADYFCLEAEEPILIEHIREIQDYIKYGPLKARHLIVVIKNLHFLADKAAHAFLKTLEEPPEGVIFLLSTNNLAAVLGTIRSRCQIFDFPGVANDVVENQLTYAAFLQLDQMARMDYAAVLSAEKEQAKLVLLSWLTEITQNLSQYKVQKRENIKKIIANIEQMQYNLNLRLHLESLFMQL